MDKRTILALVFAFLLGLAILFFVNRVSAAPPFLSTTDFTEGYGIELPHTEYIKIGTNYTVNFHVFNLSNGVPISNVSTSCFLHLTNSIGQDTLQTSAVHQTVNIVNEWDVYISGGNFSNTGLYTYTVLCNSSLLGGYKTSHLTVTGTGVELTSANATVYSSFFLIFVFLFVVVLFGITKLPENDNTNDNGEIISIGWLKYLRSLFIFIAWLILLAIFYLSSNLAFAYLGEQLFAKILFRLFQVGYMLTLPILVLWFIWIFASIIQDRKTRRLIEKGIYPNRSD